MQTDVHAFADFAGAAPIITPFAKFQKLKTLTSGFGNRLLSQINPETNKIHASYRLNGARTGRLSCSQPNLQQLPREKAVRSSFVAGEGKVLLCADYSQIELRVAAELSQDRAMLEAYRTGVDLHTLTASKLSGKPISKVTKMDRTRAKAVNFGFLYGLGSKKFSHYAKKSYQADVTEEEASQAIKTFRESYPGYREWQVQQVAQAARTLTTRTPCGKLRRLDVENTYGTAMNHPVQGGAAECMLYALVHLQNKLDSNGARLVNCVHDEVSVECSPDSVEEVKTYIADSMEQGFLDVFPERC